MVQTLFVDTLDRFFQFSNNKQPSTLINAEAGILIYSLLKNAGLTVDVIKLSFTLCTVEFRIEH
jgi:hypothetical protein